MKPFIQIHDGSLISVDDVIAVTMSAPGDNSMNVIRPPTVVVWFRSGPSLFIPFGDVNKAADALDGIRRQIDELAGERKD